MRKNLFALIFSLGMMVLIGIFIGAMIQKTIGVGALLRGVGIPYPTRTPVPVPVVSEIPPEFQGKLSLFILVGQSNMVGWAPLPDSQITDPQIYVFGNDYHWRIALEPVDDPYNQVDKVSEDRAASFGPSLAFASAIRSHQPEVIIGLIPCAKNSSAIIEWQRNLSDQSLYGSCLKRAQAASTMGHIAGMLFFQGETDTLDINDYPQYEPNPAQWSALFTAFVNDMRADLYQGDIPVVFAQLSANTNPTEAPYWEQVKEQQLSIDIPNSAMITTDDLSLIDGLHFTGDSYHIIGERFAQAYLVLLESKGQ